MSSSWRKQSVELGLYEYTKARGKQAELGLDLAAEQLMQSKDDNGSTGTEQGVKAHLTPTESEKLSEQATIHELMCGASMVYLPAWVFDEVEVPPCYYCAKCDHMLAIGYPETYFAR